MEARRRGDPLALIPRLGRPVYRGAEASLYPLDWFGVPALAKVREPKPYRHPSLDARLRATRTINEARAMAAALRAGVPVPTLLHVDPHTATLVMARLRGARTLAALVEDSPGEARSYVEQLGRYAARLHRSGIAHGDLTTSNALVDDRGRLYLIDFGLATLKPAPRDTAVDLHLFLRSLESTHPEHVEEMYEAFLRGYRAEAGEEAAERLVEGVREIRLMGRYREERRTAWGGGAP